MCPYCNTLFCPINHILTCISPDYMIRNTLYNFIIIIKKIKNKKRFWRLLGYRNDILVAQINKDGKESAFIKRFFNENPDGWSKNLLIYIDAVIKEELNFWAEHNVELIEI